MKTIYQLQQIAARLREVTEVNSISPEDTFGLQADVLEYLADMEQNAEGLGIHKVYASYAAMVADASAPVGSNGKALRFGQLVVIYNSSNTTQTGSGNVYAWQKGNTGAAAWLLMGNLGSVLGNPQNGYYVCDTADATAEKEISATGYVLSVGGSMKVKMTNANTADNATLNINSTGVKALYYAGERASSINTWEAGETVEVYYDGTSYYANNVAGGSGSGDGATIVQSTDDYTLTDLVWTDTGVRGLKNSSDFWLNSGDKLNFSYTASYGDIIKQKKSDGTYVSLFSTLDVQTLTAFEFICQVGGYYRFNVNSIENIVITPSYTADKKESISSATNSLSKQILDIEFGISRCEEFLIESSFYQKNTGKVWNQATSELVSVSYANSSCVAIIEVEGVTDIHFKRSTWSSSYCPTFFSTKNSDEFNAETMVGYASVNTASMQKEFYVSVPANAKVICISLKNDIIKSQNIFFRKYYNKEPSIKVKRTWASIGDSITRINNDNLYTLSESSVNAGTFKTIKGYQGYLQERIKFDGFTNLGVNGANSLTYPWDDIIVADIYTIALGINDWGAGNAVGTISDYKSWASGDTVDNFAKGIARIVKKIRTLNAYADIIIMTPTKAISGYFPTSSNSPSDNGQHTYLHEYADMLIEIADYEGFPVVDIYHHGNYNDGNIQYWTYDKCHPNDRGSRKIANLLFPVMRYFSDEYYTKN